MRRFLPALIAGCLSGLLLVARLSAAGAANPPVPIALSGGSGGIGFDDLRWAPSVGAVLVPAGRMGALDLVDPATRAVTAITGFSKSEKFAGGHGEGTTSADEGLGYLFATDRTSGELAVVDPKEKRIVARARLSSGPDYVRFVAPTGELWVTEPDKERIEIFRLGAKRPPAPESSGFIAVPGGPESLVIETKGGRAYSHLWGGRTVAIDVKSRSVVSTWTNGCKGSRGIALDEERGFLFVGCAEGKAVVLEKSSGKTLSTLTAGDGVDIIDFDPKLSHLYFPGGKSATLSILGVSPKGQLSLLDTVPSAAGAHCVTSDLRGTAYVCDPGKGRLLAFRDAHPASR